MADTVKRSELVALVDMDGTLCDYQGAMLRDLERLRSPGEPPLTPDFEDSPWLRARQELIRGQPGWWARLEPRKQGFEVLAELRALEFELHVLTKGPVQSTNAWAEKLQWCQAHVPDARVTVTMDKGLVYGKVLVDDWPEYIHRWLTWRPRGLVIVPAQPWNVGFTHPNAIRYDGTNLDAVRARLQAVRETALSEPPPRA
ncbi:5' nucleotidase, NT5C type [Pyxidicoccus sp. 3LG]